MEDVVEGYVKIKVPGERSITKKDKVFYNPKMAVNRDISVAVVQSFLNRFKRERFLVCDPLGGSGVRGIRYAKELINPSGKVEVFINDINPHAYEAIKENVKLNNLENVKVFNKDANVLLSEHFRTFNLVDIDPFGSPNPYLDSAIRSCITRDGIIAMTATDTAVLYGSYRKACIRNYDAIPLPGDKELAVRLLIGYAIRVAGKYDIGLRPILSHFTDHYIRTFLVTERGAKRADEAMERLGYVKIENEEKVVRKREEGFERGFGGLFYLGEISDIETVKDALRIAQERGYSKRSIKILEEIYQECTVGNVIGCYNIHRICSAIREHVPPVRAIVEMLRERGFRASRVHYDPNGIKTDGKVEDVIECIREYNRRR
ncbi:MAG TPA: tRNA (guanine(26)-N(2))-dimethyltransferase [Methanothermococcus okinawensis]|uniref:tRNA (guanine(26)-N(2))-dimethyltransferase n=1 Tax=Methanothermococcus okinawensis TaxID=155863 RepID=A0A833A7W6_9EURY|nr:tRNA (guanine(26)-N(2))-dimethyltransferase [Methanothermococcus okinawensis]